MTALAIVVLLVAIILLMRGRPQSEVIGLAASFPAGVAVTVGGEGIPIFYGAVIVALAVSIFASAARRGRSLLPQLQHRAGRTVLLFFALWSILVTATAPTVFRGVEVLVPRLGIDAGVLDPGELQYTISNAAQVVYLLLGVSLVFLLARTKVSPATLAIPLIVMTGLSFARLISQQVGLPWPTGFFDNAPNRNFIEETATGQIRFRGIFAEPSTLATYSIVTVAYFWKSVPRWRGAPKTIGIIAIVMAAINAVISTAGTTVAAGLLVAALILGTSVAGWFRRGARIPGGVIASACFAVAIGAFFIPQFVSTVGTAVMDKIGSGSFTSRTGADTFSFSVLVDTWGFGAGLGSSRPSSFFPMLLSCVGIIGAIAFVAAGFLLARAAWKSSAEIRPTVWAFVALFVCKSVAGPNLSDPFIWLSLGLFASYAWQAHADQNGEPDDHSRTASGTYERRPAPRRVRSRLS